MNLPGAAQDEWEFGQFLNVIDDLTIESILEIGVWQGGTLARFGQRFPYATIVGIDPAPQLERWAPEWGNMHLITGKSQDEQTRAKALTENYHRKFDVIWIDGDHEIGPCTEDWTWALRFANKAIAFHDIIDSNNSMIEVWRLWNVIHADPNFRTMEINRHDSNNYGIGVVFLDG
jgi:hypothetical protein